MENCVGDVVGKAVDGVEVSETGCGPVSDVVVATVTTL